MKITLHCIGKMDKSSPEHHIIDRYKTRLPWIITIREYEVKKNLPEDRRKEAESLLLLESLPKHAAIIALDERGKNPSTAEFAKTVARWNDQGIHELVFLIGGASGHGSAALARSDYTLSLGSMTWPHLLVRAMLIEQLYRIFTLSSGHPYHK